MECSSPERGIKYIKFLVFTQSEHRKNIIFINKKKCLDGVENI